MDEEGPQKAGLSQAGPWPAGTESGLVASQQLWAPPRTIGLARTDIGPGGAATHPGPGGFALHPALWRPGRQRGSRAPPPRLPGFPCSHLLLGDVGDPRTAPCHKRGSPPRLPVLPPVAPPLLGVAVSSETTGFHQEIISSQQGQLQFGSSGFMDNKKACPHKEILLAAT